MFGRPKKGAAILAALLTLGAGAKASQHIVHDMELKHEIVAKADSVLGDGHFSNESSWENASLFIDIATRKGFRSEDNHVWDSNVRNFTHDIMRAVTEYNKQIIIARAGADSLLSAVKQKDTTGKSWDLHLKHPDFDAKHITDRGLYPDFLLRNMISLREQLENVRKEIKRQFPQVEHSLTSDHTDWHYDLSVRYEEVTATIKVLDQHIPVFVSAFRN